jgi:integrase
VVSALVSNRFESLCGIEIEDRELTSGKGASVNLKRKIKINGEWKFVPVAKKNGRYLPDQVLIADVPTKVKDGSFFIEWREGGQRIQKAVGKNGHEAIEAQKTQSNIHDLRASGVTVDQDAPQIATDLESLAGAIDGYLHDTRIVHRPKTMAKYREALLSFLAFTKKRSAAEVGADDIRDFMAHLTLEKNLMPKTVKVKGRIVHGVLTGLGATLPMKRGDWPKTTKKTRRPMYATDTLKQLLASVSREHFILWSFFLHTGFREQEVAFCSWADVNFRRNEVSVTKKTMAQHGFVFTPKTHEERTVRVVSELMDLLREHKATLPADSFLVFPTRPAKGHAGLIKRGGRNMLNMLDLLKLDYFRAGMNCGTCRVVSGGQPTTCVSVPQCQKAGLHMFRHTSGTNSLRAGLNIVDVSAQLGHKDVATTMIYLHDLGKEDLGEKLEKTNLGTMYLPDEFKPVEHKRIHIVSDEARKRMSEGGKKSARAKLKG